jgi:hypothetical protein
MDFYQDPGGGASGPGAGQGPQPTNAPQDVPVPEDETEDAGEDTGTESALLPKSLLGGGDLKPGSTVTLKIVHVYEDEVEVERGETEEEVAPMGGGMGMGGPMGYESEIDAMATKE